MSYVLDALKRADAERERGAVPGLHAQPVPLLPADADTPRPSPPWLWLGVGLAIGLLAAFAWLVGGRESAGEVAAPVAVAAQPVVAAPIQAAPTPPPPITRLPAVAAHPPPSASAADTRVLALHELPETVRRELPTLAINGSLYSEVAAQRFLIINGRVVHEKEEVAPNLRLEQIKLKAAVLKYKDYRYTIAF
jgi:general secretion pathway protein B